MEFIGRLVRYYRLTRLTYYAHSVKLNSRYITHFPNFICYLFWISDHILATAATNGAVAVWNLNRPSRSKQEHVFVEHNRTVNKVSFNPVESSWLISGSQDGTMRTFDLRTKTATNVFHRLTLLHYHHNFYFEILSFSRLFYSASLERSGPWSHL